MLVSKWSWILRNKFVLIFYCQILSCWRGVVGKSLALYPEVLSLIPSSTSWSDEALSWGFVFREVLNQNHCWLTLWVLPDIKKIHKPSQSSTFGVSTYWAKCIRINFQAKTRFCTGTVIQWKSIRLEIPQAIVLCPWAR